MAFWAGGGTRVESVENHPECLLSVQKYTFSFKRAFVEGVDKHPEGLLGFVVGTSGGVGGGHVEGKLSGS